jgi:hypothetical protein
MNVERWCGERRRQRNKDCHKCFNVIRFAVYVSRSFSVQIGCCEEYSHQKTIAGLYTHREWERQGDPQADAGVREDFFVYIH